MDRMWRLGELVCSELSAELISRALRPGSNVTPAERSLTRAGSGNFPRVIPAKQQPRLVNKPSIGKLSLGTRSGCAGNRVF